MKYILTTLAWLLFIIIIGFISPTYVGIASYASVWLIPVSIVLLISYQITKQKNLLKFTQMFFCIIVGSTFMMFMTEPNYKQMMHNYWSEKGLALGYKVIEFQNKNERLPNTLNEIEEISEFGILRDFAFEIQYFPCDMTFYNRKNAFYLNINAGYFYPRILISKCSKHPISKLDNYFQSQPKLK